MKTAQFALVATGAGILSILLLLEVIAFPPDESILKRTPLLEGTEEFKRWSSVKYLTSFYIFNTTNPDQVRKGEPPVLKEFGPYVYEDEEVKSGFEYSENDTVSFNLTTRPLRFRPDLSTGPDKDKLLVLQEDLIRVAHFAKSSEYSQGKAADAGAKHPEVNALFAHITAGELIQGRKSRLLKTLWQLVVGDSEEGEFSLMRIKQNFGESSVEEVKVGSGERLLDIGQSVRFYRRSKLRFWRHPCDILKGTRETTFPPNIHRSTALQVFIPHLLRPFTFKFEKEVIFDGIEAYRFSLAGDELRYSPNSCYCKDGPGVKEEHVCPVNGTTRLYWQHDPPSTYSFPHFLFGTRELLSSVRGLEASPERHQSYIDIEPVSGIVLSSHIRIQRNHNLFRHNLTKTTEEFAQVPEIIYPFAWWDQAYELTDEAVKNALRRRDIPLSAFLGVGKWLLWVLGLAALSSGLLLNKIQRSGDYEGRDAVLMSDTRTADE